MWKSVETPVGFIYFLSDYSITHLFSPVDSGIPSFDDSKTTLTTC